MRWGIRGRLLFVSLGLIALADLLVGLYLESRLTKQLQEQVELELHDHAAITAQWLKADAPRLTPAEVDPIADRIGLAAHARVSVLDGAGRVIGDSALSSEALRQLGSASEYPEVAAAVSGVPGTARRHSDALGMDMFFVAMRSDIGGEPIIIRVAVPTEHLEAEVGELRAIVLVGSVVGLLGVAIALGLVSTFAWRTLRAVADTVGLVTEQDLHGGREGDIEGLAASLKRMARDLEQTLEMLETERNRFETVLETMEQAVVALDADQRVTTVNRAAREVLNIAEEVEGRTLLEVTRTPTLKKLADEVEVGSSKVAEFDFFGPANRRLQARATVQASGGVVLVLDDLTELHRLERIRRDFVANVSHELRTPLSVIKANTETLLDGALEDRKLGRRFLEAVHRHADRLGRLVADLLDISRIEAGRYRLELSNSSIFDVAEDVVEVVAVEAQARDIRVENHVDPDLTATADSEALEHVLLNLVDNGVKYCQQGGHVEVRGGVVDGMVRVEVRDNGPGIEPRHRQRVFERFYRVDAGRSRETGGTGLGLSIVKHLVEAMNGEVGVASNPPRGSVFWFQLDPPSPGDSSVQPTVDVEDETVGDVAHPRQRSAPPNAQKSGNVIT